MTAPTKKPRRQYRSRDTADEDDESSAAVTSTGIDDATGDAPGVEGHSVSLVLREALELRKFRRRAPGMDLADLNRGDTSRRGGKKDKTAAADADNDDPWKLKSGGGLINMDQVRGMTFGGDDADKAATTAGGGFATESNAMDTERHMREFIEKEMRKRRGDDGGAAGPSGGAETTDSKDPHDELFQIPDHLKTISAPVSEGNVTLSTSMLTAIPEIDLGITSKLKNIEETEKAKRKLIERNTSVMADKLKMGGGTEVASERYWTGHKYQQRRDDDRDQGAANNGAGGERNQDGSKKKFDRRTMATDEMVMERFKKRIRRG